MKTSKSTSFSRLALLLKYDWLMNKRTYLTALFGVLGMIILVYQVVLYSNSGYLTFGTGYSHGIFISGYFILCLLWLGQSFLALRNPQNAKTYLMLPASPAEKYLTELLTKMIGLLVIYPVIFWVAANVGLGLFQIFGPLLFNNVTIDLIGIWDWKEFWLIQNFGEQLLFVKLILLGLFALIPSLMWAGSLIFKRYNFLWMPVVLVLVWLGLSATTIALSWIMRPGLLRVNGELSFQMLNFDQPQIFPETPLLIGMSVLWIWLAVILSYVVAYFKLTEKQV